MRTRPWGVLIRVLPTKHELHASVAANPKSRAAAWAVPGTRVMKLCALTARVRTRQRDVVRSRRGLARIQAVIRSEHAGRIVAIRVVLRGHATHHAGGVTRVTALLRGDLALHDGAHHRQAIVVRRGV